MTVDQITNAEVDRAYEVMCEELNHWQIVGPLVERRRHLPDREYWNAVRTTVLDHGATVPEITHLDCKANAVACVQWHGLRAVVAAIKGELAPSVSETSSNDNGDTAS